MGQNASPADDLDFEMSPLATMLQDRVDQEFHGIVTVARGSIHAPVLPPISPTPLADGEHEVIHAANATNGVADTRRDAGAQHGHDDFILNGDVTLSWQELGGGGAMHRVPVAVDMLEARQYSRKRL